ncbi:MAG TPA: DUF790 family protein [Thermoanaerobaculia bacterium]|jgi:hypothetical protein
MLTSDLLSVRLYKNEIRPRYIDASHPESLALAQRLIEIFAAHEGRARHELDQELKDFLGTGTDFLLHRALAKLLHDRSTFDPESPADPEELRRAAFEAAAAAWRRPHDSEDPRPFRFDRDETLAAAAAGLEIEPRDLERGLYADLKDEQVLTTFKRCRPQWLLRRYNTALAQAVLLRAEELTVRLEGQAALACRELFRKIKFFQLLHRVTRLDEGYEIVLDGPASLFKAGTRYGVQMASFLPTLLHFEGWTLEARLRWGKRRLRRDFYLTPEAGLRPHTRLLAQWQPEELRWFPEQFAKLESAWEASADAELVELGGQGVLVPDFVFRHLSGTRVYMEVFGFWRKGAIDSRLKLLRRHGPRNLILALSKGLAADQEGLDEIPGEVYVFRSSPIARQVLKLLEGYL